MTDNLVERLRAIDHYSVEECFCQSHLYDKAADRIEDLNAQIGILRTEKHADAEAIGSLVREMARLRRALSSCLDDLHEIEAGDMSTFEAQDAIRAALQDGKP
jgi:ribosome assembly protein YihI (activator of Der GTPase)